MIFAIIPVKRFENSKSRLAPLLSLRERITLSGLMLNDTLATLVTSNCFEKILVVTGNPRAKEIALRHNAIVIWQEDDTGVNSAVALGDAYSTRVGAQSTTVLPQDLSLMRATDIAKVCTFATRRPFVTLCPSLRFDGTNVLLRSPPEAIATYYDHNSYQNHLKAAAKAGVPIKVLELKNLMFDLDTPNDIQDLVKMPDNLVSAKSSYFFIKSLLSDRSV